MTASNSILDCADQLQALTREYSRFSRSAGGLSAVFGGVLCLASYLAGGLLSASPPLQGALIATPLVWLLIKQWLTSRYYQRFGQVEERVSVGEQRMHSVFTGFTALLCIVVAAGTLADFTPFGLRAWEPRSIAYVLTLLAMPLIVWRWLRNPVDFAVGVFLISQAALVFGGGAYPLWSSAVVFPVAALIMICVGIADHRKFLGIEKKIRELMRALRAQT